MVDVDLEKFFDRVNHDVLMARVARRVKDRRVLVLIRRYLQAGMMDGGLVSPRREGTPQGGPLSPLLSNILLDEWDRELGRRGHRFVRYADDCNVYVRSKAAGERVLISLERFLAKRLRLRVNREKSGVARPWTRKFLGYSVTWDRAARLRVSPAAVTRLKTKLRAVLSRGRGRRLADVVREINLATREGGSSIFGSRRLRRVSRVWISGFVASCAACCGDSGSDHGPGSTNVAGVASTRLALAHLPSTAVGRGGMPARVTCTRPCPPPCFGNWASSACLMNISALHALREPPDADRHVRWCGR